MKSRQNFSAANPPAFAIILRGCNGTRDDDIQNQFCCVGGWHATSGLQDGTSQNQIEQHSSFMNTVRDACVLQPNALSKYWKKISAVGLRSQKRV